MQEWTDNQQPVTIPDIAFAAGVSRTTVSMVLNGKADRYRISAATRQRVEAVIAQSGYQPNRLARNMRLGRSTLGGLIVAEGTQDVGDLLAGLEPLLAGAGYNLVVATVGANHSSARERIRRLNHDGLAGLIYGPGFPIGESPVLAGLGPTLILGLPAAGLPGVFHDDEPVGQIRPAGMQRSERRRGQAAGEQLLSMLTGAPPGNRRVPLTPVESVASELLSSRVVELPREDAEGQAPPVSSTPKPDNSATQQPATEAEPPVPIPVPPRRPELIIPAPVVEAPVVTGVPPEPVAYVRQAAPITEVEDVRLDPPPEIQTPTPVFEEPTPVLEEPPTLDPVFEPEPVAPTLETPAIAQDPVFDAATPEIRQEEPQTPAPVVETPVVTGVPPVSATSPEEIPAPADPVPPVVVTPEPEPPLVIQETLTPAIDTTANVAPAFVPEPVIATPVPAVEEPPLVTWPEEPPTPAPVVETPVVTGVPPVSATSPEEIPTPADPVPPVSVIPEPEPPLVLQETPTPAIETAASVAPSLVPEPVIATPATPTPNNSATQQPTTEVEPPTPPPPPAEIIPPVIVIPMAEPPTGVVSETPVSSEIVSEPEGVADSEPAELKPEPEIP
jgi:hypothetical protein